MTYVRTTLSSREFIPLPIDNTRGFPQSFPLVFNGTTYHFWLYVNVAAERLADTTDPLSLPGRDAHMVVRVQVELEDGTRSTIFMRKIIPGLEYETESIVLSFDKCEVYARNLGGVGDFGSNVKGGIAARWE